MARLGWYAPPVRSARVLRRHGLHDDPDHPVGHHGPPGQIPLFLSLVGHRTPEYRRRAAWQAPLVSLLVISIFAIGGKAILNYLHIGIPALQAPAVCFCCWWRCSC